MLLLLLPYLVVFLCCHLRVVQAPHPAGVNPLAARALEKQLQRSIGCCGGAAVGRALDLCGSESTLRQAVAVQQARTQRLLLLP